MYLLITNDNVSKFPYTLEELRADNPHTSFPIQMSEEELAAWGVFEVEDQSPPEFNEQTESIEIGAPALVDGKWIRAWSVVAAAPEEVERRTIVQAGLIRTERNRLLTATDYSQLPDFSGGSHNHEAITAYRQALREVPQQSGFPWSVDWPVPDLERP
jgi:hypothetical protein